jgi:transcriptional regulator with XRE-family HTH domain
MSLTKQQMIERDNPLTNPLKRFRLQEALTQEALGDLIRVSKQVVLKTEQGLYHTPTPKLSAWVERTFSVDLTKPYAQWQTTQRQKLGEREWHPAENFSVWLIKNFPGQSNMAICKQFCIHPATLRSFLLHEVRRMPVQIRVALIEAGVPGEQIERL